MNISARFTHEKVQYDKENELNLVVALTAPKLERENKRPPIAIVAVADVSGSMAGDKLDYTKKTMIKLVEHLKPGDYFGLVEFESNVRTVVQLVEMTAASKDIVKAAIGNLQVKGCTNLSGGILQGLEMLNVTDLSSNVLLRVISFTDGMPNGGVAQDEASLRKVIEANLGRASLSAFGYGADAKQDLLAGCARAGKGNYAFIKNPEDALTAFGKELGGLLSVYAQNIVIDMAPHNGHEILEVVSDVDVEEDGKKIKIPLPELLSEESRNIVLRVKLSKQSQALPREMNVLDVKVGYEYINDDGKKEKREESVKAKIRFVKEADVQKEATKEVDKLVALAQLVQKQLEAEGKAKQGDYKGAVDVMNLVAQNFSSRGLEEYERSAGVIGAKMDNQVSYNASQGYLRSTASSGTRGMGASAGDNDALVMMDALGVQLNNHTHATTVNSFVGPSGPPAGGGFVGGGIGGSIDPKVIVDLSPIAGSIVTPAAPARQEKKPESKKKDKKVKSKSERW